MEKKKTLKISLLTFFLILAIIAICVMVVFIYKINNDKLSEEHKSAELQSQVNSLNESVSQLQEKIETISNTTISNTTFSEEEVKEAISEYLELQASANCGTPLDKLKEKGKINYDPSNYSINTNNGLITTDVKFSDYKNAMLNYVTESEFEKNWTSEIGLGEDNNGYLTHSQGGGGLRTYTINSVSKIDDKTFSVKTTSMVEDDNTTKEDENFTFEVTSYNGKCVIDSVK